MINLSTDIKNYIGSVGWLMADRYSLVVKLVVVLNRANRSHDWIGVLPSALHRISNVLNIFIQAEHQSGDRKLNKNPENKRFLKEEKYGVSGSRNYIRPTDQSIPVKNLFTQNVHCTEIPLCCCHYHPVSFLYGRHIWRFKTILLDRNTVIL